MDKLFLDIPFFSQILNAIHDGVVVEDSCNQIVFVNNCFCRMLGITEEEAIGNPSIDYIYDSDKELFLSKTNSRDCVKSESYPIRLKSKAGPILDVLVAVQALSDAAGAYMGNLAVLTNISSLKENQRQLEESNDRFKTLCDVTSEGILIHSGEIIVDGNAPFFQMLGYDRAELVGQSITRLMTEESIKSFEQRTKDKYEGYFEVEGVKKNGTVFSCYAHSKFSSFMGQPVRIVSILDLTELKTHQHEKELLLSLLDHISDSVVVVDFDTLRVLDGNRTAYKSRKLSKEEFLNKSISELTSVSPDQLIEIKKQLPVIKQKQIEYEHVRADGSMYRVESTLTYYELEGKPYVIAVARDISERKRLEERITQSEYQYRSLVENSDQCIVMLDPDGTINFINSEGARQTGCRVEEMIGKKIFEFYPKQSETIRVGIANVIKSKKPFLELMKASTVFGLRWKLVTRIPLLDDEDKVYAIQIIVKDIDDMKRLEDENQLYYRQMEKTERLAAIGTLTGMMSHEINQPLTVVKLLLQDLSNRMGQGLISLEDTQLCVEDCLAEVERSISILKHYREVLRTDQSEDSKTITPISKTLEKLRHVFNKSCEKNNIILTIDETINVQKPRWTPCDIEQIAFILISNAIDASDPDQESGITMSAEILDEQLVLTVSDQGTGIKPDDQKRLFEPFFSTKTRDKGTGLGLPIVKRILDNCGGRIDFQSEWGKGTTFKVTVPLGETNG